tara:strand:+ start:62 stop:256 length:195 start_codon:yes stop_codon:yes gene_type:complete
MKSEKIKTELTEIYQELAHQRALLERIVQDIKELKESVTPKTEYVHPWYQVKKKELIDSGNFVA